MAGGLVALREEAGIPVAEMVARQIQELGLSFRMTGEAEERPWPLSPMPLVIGASQWAAIERGLIQRAEVIEAVTADIYGEQRLVADGHLPAALEYFQEHPDIAKACIEMGWPPQIIDPSIHDSNS